MNPLQCQRGFTLGSLMFFMLLVGFFVYAAFRVIPGYIDFWMIEKVMSNVANQPEVDKIKDSELRMRFAKELRLNNVKVISMEDLNIERIPNGVQLSAEFSSKQHFMGPVSLCMDFRPEAQSK